MEFITPIASIIAIIVAIFSIPKTLHAINEQKRKKFRDELDFYKEYFENYYQKKDSNIPLLVRDKAAHTLTRSTHINANLANYFVELHENKKADFQKVIDSFHFGHKYINVDEQNWIFNPTIKKLTQRRKLYYFSIVPLISYIFLLYGTDAGSSLHIIIRSLGALFSLILIIQLLDKTLNIEEAENFFKIIEVADNKAQGDTHVSIKKTIDLAS